MPPMNRRRFLQASAALGAGTVLPPSLMAAPRVLKPTADAVILLMMTGGPSQHDTWDPKPNAPSGIRSPFAPIRTTVPGLQVSELFPQMASLAHKLAFVRSVHHHDAPLHEVGFQYLNCGKLSGHGPEWPSMGAVVSCLKQKPLSEAVLLSAGRIRTGLDVSHGQGYGWLDQYEHGPITLNNVKSFQQATSATFGFASAAQRMGWHSVITVNQFETVFNSPSWDCHADGGALNCTLNDIRDTVAPSFDSAFSALIRNLDRNGLLERTLVVATGEFGRTPKFNCNGGRDHWAGVWTTVLAGGGVQGGRVVGASDAWGAEPKDRPVHARDIPATIFHALGFAPDTTIPGPNVTPVRIADGLPIRELF